MMKARRSVVTTLTADYIDGARTPDTSCPLNAVLARDRLLTATP